MKKKLTARLTGLIILGALFAIWNILVWTLTDLKNAKVNFYCGYGFICLAFILVACVLFLLKPRKHATAPVLIPGYIVCIAYFAITFIMNTIFMCFPAGNNAKAIVIPNAIILLLFIAAMAVAYYLTSRIGRNTEVLAQHHRALQATAIEIGQIASITENSELKKSLIALREKVEYSDPVGISETASLDEDFKRKIAEIRMLVEEGYDAELIASKIKAATNKLRERNELLMSMK